MSRRPSVHPPVVRPSDWQHAQHYDPVRVRPLQSISWEWRRRGLRTDGGRRRGDSRPTERPTDRPTEKEHFETGGGAIIRLPLRPPPPPPPLHLRILSSVTHEGHDTCGQPNERTVARSLARLSFSLCRFVRPSISIFDCLIDMRDITRERASERASE